MNKQNVKPVQPVALAIPFQPRDPLTEEEIEGIVLAVKSELRGLQHLSEKITPGFYE